MNKLLILTILLITTTIAFAEPNSGNQPKKISPPDAQALLKKDSSVILLDVRTMEEFLGSRIAGAKLLPYDQINAKTAAQLIPLLDTTIVLYCRSGNRSGIAAKTFQALGYTKILDLGGIINWPYPTISGK